ncbi:MAG: DsbE family thiol:disulfide interchange protein [Boseongicola sp.]|nr:DsbE family thiol:disulfide interchange protein [Boseongicola sp.]
MPRLSPLVLLPLVVFAGLAGLFLGGIYREDPDALPSTLLGRNAPVLDVDPLENVAAIELDELTNGSVTLVNFWASWCAPCRVEHPQLMRLKHEGIAILGVNYKDDPEKARRFLDELGNPFKAVGADPRGRNAIEWGVYGVPETFVVDGKGKVVSRFAGPVTEQILERRIRPALETATTH